MRPKRFFESDKISYSDFLKTIEVMLQHKNFFCEKSCIERGVEAISKIDEDSKERLIKTAVKIDKDFSVAGAANRNCAHKLPIILKCADLLSNGGKRIDDLTQEELILVSYYYSVSPTPYEQRRFDFFLDKNVLKSIRSKSNDFDTQFDMMFAIDMKLGDLGIEEMNDEQYNITKEEMLVKINSSSKEEVLNMVNVEERIIETMKQANI